MASEYAARDAEAKAPMEAVTCVSTVKQSNGNGRNRRSLTSLTPPDLSSLTRPSNSPKSPSDRASTPTSDWQTPTSPRSPAYSPTGGTGLRFLDRPERFKFGEEGYRGLTYKDWENGDKMRLEDENLLAACSGPFLPEYRPQPQSIFLKLPLELQYEIFRNVDRRDLKALSQTCAILRAVMIPLIMETVILSAYSPGRDLVVQTLETTISNSKETAGMIRKMELSNNFANSDILARLLPFTGKLKSLVYGYVIEEMYGSDMEEKELRLIDVIDAAGIGRLLAPVRHSLTHLKITYELHVDQTYFDEMEPCVDNWCYLRHMITLERLETTFSILLGPVGRTAPKLAHVLPPRIVELNIESDPWELDPAEWNHKQRFGVFTEFVRDKSWKQFTPRLKFLNYNMDALRKGWPKKTAAMETKYIKLIRESGLECDSKPIGPQPPPSSSA